MAQHRTYLVTGGRLRRYPPRSGRGGRHRADDWYSRRVPTSAAGPTPGRHRIPGRPRRPGRRRPLASFALSVVVAVTVVSGWFAATGAVAMAAMLR